MLVNIARVLIGLIALGMYIDSVNVRKQLDSQKRYAKQLEDLLYNTHMNDVSKRELNKFIEKYEEVYNVRSED